MARCWDDRRRGRSADREMKEVEAARTKRLGSLLGGEEPALPDVESSRGPSVWPWA